MEFKNQYRDVSNKRPGRLLNFPIYRGGNYLRKKAFKRGKHLFNFYSFVFVMKNHFLITRYIRLHNV